MNGAGDSTTPHTSVHLSPFHPSILALARARIPSHTLSAASRYALETAMDWSFMTPRVVTTAANMKGAMGLRICLADCAGAR